jgi:HPt (histidine-containing phosphotransfer) domain-containing protein
VSQTTTVRLDLGRLAELRDLDESFVDQAIERFLARAVDDLAVLNAAMVSGDRVQLGMVAHRLAGAALNLGAGSLGRSAQTVEELAIRGTTDMVAAAMRELGDALWPDLEALRAYQQECLTALPA